MWLAELVAGGCLLAMNVSAIPIFLGITTGEPSNPPAELARLNTQIGLYNAANDPDLPAAVTHEGQVDTPDGPTSIWIDVDDCNYLLLKWDGKDEFWYVGNESGLVEFINTQVLNKKGKPQGLSHYALFDCRDGKVPDGGAGTAVLLGLGLLAVRAMRRR